MLLGEGIGSRPWKGLDWGSGFREGSPGEGAAWEKALEERSWTGSVWSELKSWGGAGKLAIFQASQKDPPHPAFCVILFRHVKRFDHLQLHLGAQVPYLFSQVPCRGWKKAMWAPRNVSPSFLGANDGKSAPLQSLAHRKGFLPGRTSSRNQDCFCKEPCEQ